MEIKGLVTVFVRENENLQYKKELWISISKKLKKEKEGDPDKFTHQNVKLVLAPDKFPQEKIEQLDVESCYKMDITKGFYTFEDWVVKGKDGKDIRRTAPVFYAQEIKITASQAIKKPIEEAAAITENDLPF